LATRGRTDDLNNMLEFKLMPGKDYSVFLATGKELLAKFEINKSGALQKVELKTP